LPGESNRHVGRLFIAAPAERIFAALTTADDLVRWMPPAGARGRLLAFEPRPGGAFDFELTFDDWQGKSTSNTDVLRGRFVTVEPNRIAVATDFQSDDPQFAGTMKMSWLLHPTGQGTEVEVIAENVPSGIGRDQHEQGIASSLANLASFVEGG
jgi:uncharacterized protein YndB with AHSA1/START domain